MRYLVLTPISHISKKSVSHVSSHSISSLSVLCFSSKIKRVFGIKAYCIHMQGVQFLDQASFLGVDLLTPISVVYKDPISDA